MAGMRRLTREFAVTGWAPWADSEHGTPAQRCYRILEPGIQLPGSLRRDGAARPLPEPPNQQSDPAQEQGEGAYGAGDKYEGFTVLHALLSHAEGCAALLAAARFVWSRARCSDIDADAAALAPSCRDLDRSMHARVAAPWGVLWDI